MAFTNLDSSREAPKHDRGEAISPAFSLGERVWCRGRKALILRVDNYDITTDKYRETVLYSVAYNGDGSPDSVDHNVDESDITYSTICSAPIDQIKVMFDEVNKALFTTVETGDDHQSVCRKIRRIAWAVHEYEGDNDDWLWIGEGGEEILCDFLVGAYWHCGRWASPDCQYLDLLCNALSLVYTPNMEGVPSEGEGGYFTLTQLDSLNMKGIKEVQNARTHA